MMFIGQLSHTAESGQNECEICRKTFKSSYDLKKHVQYGPHSDKQFSCEECSNSFPRKDNLAKHVKMVHENIPVLFVEKHFLYPK